jgi:CDP-paratose 2-epimerase
MATAIVTGSGGLIGSESVTRFCELGYDVIGLENDMRSRFFGAQASTAHMTEALLARYSAFASLDVDIRDRDGVERVFAEREGQVELVIHAAAQPSHETGRHRTRTRTSRSTRWAR